VASVALGIVASHRSFSIALRHRGEGPVVVPAGGTEAGQLQAMVSAAFVAHGLQPGDLDEIRIDLGPGSYTGLRVAVTFARTVQAFRGIAVLTTTSLQLMARAAVVAGGWESGRGSGRGSESGPDTDSDSDTDTDTDPGSDSGSDSDSGAVVRVVLDARRERYHHALIAANDNRLLTQPCAVSLDALASAVQAGEHLLAAPELHARLAAVVGDRKVRLIAPTPFDAGLLFDDGVGFRDVEPGQLEPLYLMGSYAE
jgi:tRNA threonylcarbamoyl adenosine modification protein YeaZ